MTSLNWEQFLTAIPKADIHYHLLGGVRLATMLDLAKKYNVTLSLHEAKSYYRAYQAETGSTKGGIAALTFLYTLMRSSEDYARVLLEVAEDAQATGIRYIETFWNPSDTHLTYAEVTDALVAAIDKAKQQYQVEVRLIPSINREKSPECAVEMVEQVVAYPHPYVLGIGIDYKEQNASVEMFWKAYRLAQKHDLKTTAHCSEFGLHWRNVEAGVELIGVDRIDHGYSIIDNPELTYQYAKSGLPFTVVPSNTYFLQKWPERANWCEYHPIRDMAQAGLMIIPCTDDWHMHATDGVICYRTMVEELGFDVQSLKYFILNSLEASWMPSYKKSAYLAAWQEEFDQLFEQLTETPPSFHNDLIAYRGSLHTQMMLNQDNGAL